jgi:DNA replication and repair protein RecF
MFVASLRLTDFRNHAERQVDAGSGLVVITGANGAGKTNIMEAVSLLAPGRGLRGAAFAEMARQGGGGGYAIAASLSDPISDAAPIAIGTGIAPARPGRRRVRINGAEAAANALAEWLAILWLTPAMDRIFLDGASGRRRFLDRLVLALEPGHAHHAARYEAAMRARNRLLAEDGGWDAAWLDALEAQMAVHGVAIAAARAALIEQIAPLLAEADDGVFARPEIAIGTSAEQHDSPLPPTEAAWREVLASRRRGDARAGRTLMGPHRQDLFVVHAAKQQAAEYCSTGEQKALLLAIILAHGDLVARARGRRPILLLDEIAAHLDAERRAALFARLSTDGGQVWMTGTDAALFSAIGEDATRIKL